MTTTDLTGRLLILGLLGVLWFWYLRGWWHWRRVDRGLASPRRLLALVLSTGLILLAFFPPLDTLSREFLFVRALQKIALAFWAAPLFWLAAPYHMVGRGLPLFWRRRLTRWLQPSRWFGRALRAITQPAVTWLLFVAAIVMWHDAVVVDWTMSHAPMHFFTMVLLFGVALLYWGHLVGTGPRLRRQLPGLVLFAYVVGVEIPNMATGITIAYTETPFYAYYSATHALMPTAFSVIEDQRVSGGLIWFTGSFVFFPSAVLILNRLFGQNKGDAPEYFPDWDADERMIAPGLEHRLDEKRLP